MTRGLAASGGVARLGLVAARLLLAASLALPAAANRCQFATCSQHCSVDSPNYKPQICDECCQPVSGGTNSGDGNSAASSNDRLAAVETTVGELRVMTGVLLGLVMLLLLAVVALFLHISKTLPKFHLPVFFRNNKDKVQEKPPHKPCNGVDPNATVVKIPNCQSNRSPVGKRASLSKSSRGPTEESVGLDLEPRAFRTRQPSESTCPEETSDMPEHAYDNLALSTSTIHTSTLHNTSNSSTDTLGPNVSVNTLETTLPSGNLHHSSTDGGSIQV